LSLTPRARADAKAARIEPEVSADPDAPKLDRDWFERAEIREGGRLTRKARLRRKPKSTAVRKP